MIKIHSIIVLTLLVGSVALRIILPREEGLTLRQAAKDRILFLPFNRFAFWTCIIVAVIVAGIALFKVMAKDLGLQ